MTSAAKVLIVDDESAIERMLRPYLSAEGYSTIAASSGAEALPLIERERPDVVLLDLQMPGMSGLDVLRSLHGMGSDALVIVLTGRADEVDRIVGLELGADDYVTKPFSPREVAARVKAVLRRRPEPRNALLHTKEAEDRSIVAGALVLNLTERTVRLDDVEVPLTPTEFRLLEILASQPGRAFSRVELLDRIATDALEIGERSLDTHIAHLRAKIEETAGKPRYILTVYGYGYKFNKAPQRGA